MNIYKYLFKVLAVGLVTASTVWCFQAVVRASMGDSKDGYHLIKKVHLGGEGFYDYLGIDPVARHVFVTNNTRVVVIDADTGGVITEITDPKINGVHGVAVAQDLGRGFTSNGLTNTSTIFDLKTLKPIGSTPTGQRPDAIIYDTATQQVFVFNGDSHDTTVIAAATGQQAATIPLGGTPEFAASDGMGMVFVNIEDKNEVVAIDSRTLKIVGRRPTAPCEEPSGMAIDAKSSRLFVGCNNKIMAVMNTHTGKVVATPAIGAGVDANRFDPGTGLAFSSNGGGTLTVIHEDKPDTYTVVENVATEVGARTMEVDPKNHNVYLVTADLIPTPPTADNPDPHPTVVKDTMRLLIYGR